MLEKNQMRKEMKKQLKMMDPHIYELWSSQIAETLFSRNEWKKAKMIGITISSKLEVETKKIIEQAWAEKKDICVPKCDPLTKSMTFRKITSYEQLEIVYYGLKEPIENATVEVHSHEIDVLVVPGLSFAKNGYRLGHGGGYYDRYLKGFSAFTLSLAFPFQIVDQLPVESFDQPVKLIITTNEVIECDTDES